MNDPTNLSAYEYERRYGKPIEQGTIAECACIHPDGPEANCPAHGTGRYPKTLSAFEQMRGRPARLAAVYAPPGYGVPDCPELFRTRLRRYRERSGRLLPDVRR